MSGLEGGKSGDKIKGLPIAIAPERRTDRSLLGGDLEAFPQVGRRADRQILAKQLNISPHQLSYVTHSGEGEGLLFYGNVILPFVDRFPQDTELYRIMTTKFSDGTGEAG